ncbi:MAG: glutathione S-transferase family protein [Rhodospirillaceae bacterium]|jgi:glutathione S-transferase|nr:glutathione S-transferase family protein [Rhodospirillaceae bacterium]MBT6512270.1 glutathione S-transferase family protein [Rhodospirillaceae bacterium]MBT7613082.1 glutathione S-transferase family protein [Rhodospirillaceae bacterium]MBT7646509.1 glutathione S-transferase family protein [Rhodospirillaceae bacterium]
MTQTACYFISGSPPCWTVMLALAVKGVPYDAIRLSNTKGDQKAEDFRAVNPRGTVPVLVDGAVNVRETNAVLAYLDAAYPEPALFGSSPGETAAIWQVVQETEARYRTPIGNITRPIFRGKAAEKAEELNEAIVAVRRELHALEEQIGGRDWLVGDVLTAADLALYPAVMQLMRGATKDDAAALELKVAPLTAHFPVLAAWCQRIEALPGYDSAYPPHWR